MNTRPSRRLFILIRSPSSAPPVRRRVGSTASTAMRASGKYWRKRETSSSVTVLLPAPPVPVMPTTGTAAPAAVHCARSWSRLRSGTTSSSSADSVRAMRQIRAGRRRVGKRRQLLGARGALDQVGDHPLEAELLAMAREIDALDPVRLELGGLGRGDRAAATAEDPDVAGALLAEHVDRVLEVLEVAALVGADRDPVGVLLDRRAHDIGNAAVVPEVDDLGPRRLDEPAHHVDRRVVAVEQRRGGHEAERRALRRGLVLHPSEHRWWTCSRSTLLLRAHCRANSRTIDSRNISYLGASARLRGRHGLRRQAGSRPRRPAACGGCP